MSFCKLSVIRSIYINIAIFFCYSYHFFYCHLYILNVFNNCITKNKIKNPPRWFVIPLINLKIAKLKFSTRLIKKINNEVDKITSIVLAPGERMLVKTTTNNNAFTLMGFEDTSTEFTLRNYESQ